MVQIIEIPRDTRQLAVERLEELARQDRLSAGQAEELLSYLQETQFGQLRYWVGEKAAALLRERASTPFKARIWEMCDAADDRQLYFLLLALMNEKKDWPRLEPHLVRAVNSEDTTLRALGSELLWTQSPAAARAVLAKGKARERAKSLDSQNGIVNGSLNKKKRQGIRKRLDRA